MTDIPGLKICSQTTEICCFKRLGSWGNKVTFALGVHNRESNRLKQMELFCMCVHVYTDK